MPEDGESWISNDNKIYDLLLGGKKIVPTFAFFPVAKRKVQQKVYFLYGK